MGNGEVAWRVVQGTRWVGCKIEGSMRGDVRGEVTRQELVGRTSVGGAA